jgi:hypothetical protein
LAPHLSTTAATEHLSATTRRAAATFELRIGDLYEHVLRPRAPRGARRRPCRLPSLPGPGAIRDQRTCGVRTRCERKVGQACKAFGRKGRAVAVQKPDRPASRLQPRRASLRGRHRGRDQMQPAGQRPPVIGSQGRARPFLLLESLRPVGGARSSGRIGAGECAVS